MWSRALWLLIVTGVTLTIIGHHTAPGDLPDTTTGWPAWIVDAVLNGTAWVRIEALGWGQQHPWLAASWCATAGGPLLLGLTAQLRPTGSARDPRRLFDPAQRRAGLDRAQGRCEMENWLFLRCRRPASHGDHWIPWSRGGATDISNFVAACSRCNLTKSSTMPTTSQAWRLQHRRRRYFPAETSPQVGSRVVL